MDVKKIQKKYGIILDEEKDAFLSSLNKRYRNNRKKLDAIEDLEKRDRATLKAEQLEKIKTKAEILENVKYLDGIRDMYYSALKTAQDEGKLPKTTEAAAPTKTEEQPSEAKAPEVKPEPVQQKQVPTQSAEERQAELARISRDNLSKIVNLVHFAQFFRDHHRVQEFRQAFEANRGDFQLESAPEFEIVSEFYTKVFNFTESDKLGKVADKTNRSVGELENYVNGVDQPALRNKTYRHLQHVVEGVVSSAFFRDHSADIEVHHHRQHQHPHHHEHGAIGSTRKGHETEKLDVPAEADQLVPHVGGNAQDKHKSPEKAHHHAEPAKTQPQEHKPDWTAVEDEEEEGAEGYEGEEGEEQAGEAEEEKQEKKEDDGWATVASKKKEKKEEPFRGSGAGFRGRGRGGRGGRGGFRGERKPRPEGEAGQEGERREGGERRGGYRGPRQDRRSPGEEGVEGENAGEGQREGHRGGRGGYRGGRGGYRGEGRGHRGGYRGEGRGGYRGGQRGPREEGTERPAGSEVVNKQE